MQFCYHNVNDILLFSSFFTRYHFSEGLLSDLKLIIKKEKIRMKLIKSTDNKFELCLPDKSIKLFFQINNNTHIMKYDIYFNRYNAYIDADKLFNFKKLSILLDTFESSTFPNYLPDIMFILDEAIHWAHKHNYSISNNNLT